jgi:hypothetical protein
VEDGVIGDSTQMSISDMTEQSIIKNGLIEKMFQEEYIFDIETEIKMKMN